MRGVSFGLPPVPEYLHPAVHRVGDIDDIAVVDRNAGRQLELSGLRPARSEIIKQAALRIEHLDGFKERIHQVQVAIRVRRDAFGTVQAAALDSEFSEGAEKCSFG